MSRPHRLPARDRAYTPSSKAGYNCLRPSEMLHAFSANFLEVPIWSIWESPVGSVDRRWTTAYIQTWNCVDAQTYHDCMGFATNFGQVQGYSAYGSPAENLRSCRPQAGSVTHYRRSLILVQVTGTNLGIYSRVSLHNFVRHF